MIQRRFAGLGSILAFLAGGLMVGALTAPGEGSLGLVLFLLSVVMICIAIWVQTWTEPTADEEDLYDEEEEDLLDEEEVEAEPRVEEK